MTDLTLESLAERLDRLQQRSTRLERQNRRLRMLAAIGLALIVAVGAAAILLAGARLPSTLAARRFVLRDADGRMRAELAFTKDKEPAVKLYDGKGMARVSLDLSAPGPNLVMHNAEGKRQVRLRAAGAATTLDMSDENGKTRMSLLVVTPGGVPRMEPYPSIHLWNAEGRERVSLRADESASYLSLQDVDSRGRVELSVRDFPQRPHLRLLDIKGQPLFEAP